LCLFSVYFRGMTIYNFKSITKLLIFHLEMAKNSIALYLWYENNRINISRDKQIRHLRDFLY